MLFFLETHVKFNSFDWRKMGWQIIFTTRNCASETVRHCCFLFASCLLLLFPARLIMNSHVVSASLPCNRSTFPQCGSCNWNSVYLRAVHFHLGSMWSLTRMWKCRMADLSRDVLRTHRRDGRNVTEELPDRHHNTTCKHSVALILTTVVPLKNTTAEWITPAWEVFQTSYLHQMLSRPPTLLLWPSSVGSSTSVGLF